MNDSTPVSSWLIEKMPADVYRRVNEMARTDDVVHVAVMPDVHLSREYCVGTAVATNSRLFPTAVGADIGCGMAAVQVVDGGDLFQRYDEIGTMLKMLRSFVPPLKQSSAAGLVDELPDELKQMALSCPRLLKFALRDGRYQLGTLGRGNHFLEFQRDEAGELWIMLHSGSRAMGQVINRTHLQNAEYDSRLPYLDSNNEAGQNYLLDVRWARQYASMNRRRMLELTEALLLTAFKRRLDWSSLIENDHNHVQHEVHFGQSVWVHRKGTQRVAEGELGVIPGSMGTASFQVVGRGCEAALNSSSHGAGRRLSRTEARQQLTAREVRHSLPHELFREGKLKLLLDEAPGAYKDIEKVIRVQKDLVKITRRLTPVFTYKGV